jgi:hypothetical protein
MDKSTTSKKEGMVFYSPPKLPTNRPIFLGNPNLIPSDHLPNGRPMLIGTRQVASLDHLPLHRPIFHSESKIVAMHGDRPVFKLTMNLIASNKLPEHRPISTSRWIQDHNMMDFLD